MSLMRVAGILALAFCSMASVAIAEEQVPHTSAACLDTVWQTVYENHYDPTFGGVDWRAIHGRYRARVTDAQEDGDFVGLMNEMLQELGLSHYSVFRTQEKRASGSPLLSAGYLGLSIRLLDSLAVVTSTRPGGPAAQAGLRPGFVIEGIDGVPVSRLIREASMDPPPHLNPRGQLSAVTDEIGDRFYGEPGSSVTLSYAGAGAGVHQVALVMAARSGRTIIADDFPPLYVDFEARRLAHDIGYISFSAFLPSAGEQFIAAVDSMADLKGLIIDIRGNPGGLHEVGEAIAAKVVQDSTEFSVFRYRDHTDRVVVQPDPPVYDWPIVLLVDVMNASASERFAACMQSIGRAVVVGERSPGLVGPSEVKRLPNGASLMYLVAQSLTPDGTVLEGHGVIPDVVSRMDRVALLAGDDSQLQRAIEHIRALGE
jgi:carboxyl-terminal processing protease